MYIRAYKLIRWKIAWYSLIKSEEVRKYSKMYNISSSALLQIQVEVRMNNKPRRWNKKTRDKITDPRSLTPKSMTLTPNDHWPQIEGRWRQFCKLCRWTSKMSTAQTTFRKCHRPSIWGSVIVWGQCHRFGGQWSGVSDLVSRFHVSSAWLVAHSRLNLYLKKCRARNIIQFWKLSGFFWLYQWASGYFSTY